MKTERVRGESGAKNEMRYEVYGFFFFFFRFYVMCGARWGEGPVFFKSTTPAQPHTV